MAALTPRTEARLRPGASRLVAGTAERVARRLDELLASSDLSRRELQATHRRISLLDREGTAPSANEFWEAAAAPRADFLVRRALAILDEELWLLTGAVRAGVCVPDDAGVSARDAYLHLVAALPDGAAIDELGRWWQRRLRRAAVAGSIPAVLTARPGEIDLVVSNHEMVLLDRAPWSHGDRLLSAFELGRNELTGRGRQRVAEAVNRLVVGPDALPPLAA